MPLTRNPFGSEVITQLESIFENSLDEIRKSSNAQVADDWEEFLSEKKLLSLIDFDVPKNMNKNLSRVSVEKPAKKIKGIIESLFPGLFVGCSGWFYYPKTGYMGWHTNHDSPTDRIYVTYSSEAKKSFFRYYEDGKVVTDYDDKGITVRRFTARGTKPYFWHCVGSDCDRVSIGFQIAKVTPKYEKLMARYAIVESEKVTDVVEWNGDTSMWSPPEGTTAVLAPPSVGIGASYVDGTFSMPELTGLGEDEKWIVFRGQRDTLLQESDWVTLKSTDQGTSVPDAWKTYRQALRDLPANTSDVDNPTWPTKPA